MARPPKRPRRTTPTQILTRDFNWRMGNLKRIWHSLGGLSTMGQNSIRRTLEKEIDFQTRAHECRLRMLEDGDTADPTIKEAIWQAERRNAEAAAFDAAASSKRKGEGSTRGPDSDNTDPRPD